MMLRKMLSLSLLTLGLAVLLINGVTLAQGPSTLNYGDSIVGTISAQAPLVVYQFNGSPGDLVTIRAVGLLSTMNPSLILLNPTQQQVAANDEDGLSDIPGDARIAALLTESGVYSIIVGGAQGTSGDFALRLAGRPPVNAQLLEVGVTRRVELPINAAPQYFTFDTGSSEPLCPTMLIVTAETPGFRFSVKVRQQDGDLMTTLRGGTLQENRVTIQANTGRYEVEVEAADPLTQGAVFMSAGCANGAPPSTTINSSPVPVPAATEAVGPVTTDSGKGDTTAQPVVPTAAGLSCGDSICSTEIGENRNTCPVDCG